MKETPLHVALHQNNFNMIKCILERNVSVDEVDVKGNSVFHLAATTNKNIIDVSRLIKCLMIDKS